MKAKKKKTAAGQATIAGTEALAPWLRGMNPEQLAAIMHGEGPARLLASAGSGKTRVVVHRIARLVDSGVDPRRILALTFSKKAADEMESRAKKLGIDGVSVGTWHRLCLRILRKDEIVDDEWEIEKGVRVVLKDVVGFKGVNWVGADVNLVETFISKCKAHVDEPGSPEAEVRARRMFGPINYGRALEAFHRFDEEMERRKILSYDDYLVRVVRHLEASEEARAYWAARFDYVIQDEQQDENPAQKRILRLLAHPDHGGHANYMVVGDVYQAIYGFRESSPESLAGFDKEWPGAVTYRLPRNYRSGSAIVAAANEVVLRARVEGIDPEPMIAERADVGSVRVQVCEDIDDEARTFAARVVAMAKAGDAKLQEHCALFRTNAQSRALEEALIKERVPYVVVGGVSFYDRREVRALLSYLRLGEGRGNVEDVERCINAPFRFLGRAFVDKVRDVAENAIDAEDSSAVSWIEVAREVGRGAGVQHRQRESVETWASILDEIRRRVHEPVHDADGVLTEQQPTRILDDLVVRTRYLEWIQRDEGEENLEHSPATNVRELVRLAAKFSTAGALLDYIEETIREARSLREDRQAGGNRVLLMNVHRSKGLEWGHVFLAGFNEGIFPHHKGDAEEERRLAYVAITRARDSLVVSHVRSMSTRAGVRDGRPSPFVEEIETSIAARSSPRGDVALAAEARV